MDLDHEEYYDRSLDMVTRVRAAKEAAQRKIESFGDVSEYEVTTICSQRKAVEKEQEENSCDGGQSAFKFTGHHSGAMPPREEH